MITTKGELFNVVLDILKINYKFYFDHERDPVQVHVQTPTSKHISY